MPAASRGVGDDPRRDILQRSELSEQPGSAFEHPVECDVRPQVLARTRPGHGSLLGDWELPDAVVVGYDDDWPFSVMALVQAIRAHTPVFVAISQDEGASSMATHYLRAVEAEVLPFPVNSPWARDYTPLQRRTRRGSWSWIHTHREQGRPLDGSFGQHLAKLWDQRPARRRVALEGGGIISNGCGLVALTTASLAACGVDPHDEQRVDSLLLQLGARRAAIVPHLPGEGTGHIDMLAQFVSPQTVLVASADRISHPTCAAALDLAAEVLVDTAGSMGQRLRVVRVPMLICGEVFYSYVNGLCLGRQFLIPSYRDVPPPVEQMAYQHIQKSLADLELVPIDAGAIIERGGAIDATRAAARRRAPQATTAWKVRDLKASGRR